MQYWQLDKHLRISQSFRTCLNSFLVNSLEKHPLLLKTHKLYSSAGVAITNCHRVGSCQTTEMYFSPFQKVEVRDQVTQHGQERVLFWVADFPLYPHMEERAKDLSGTSFIKALKPFTQRLYAYDLVSQGPTSEYSHTRAQYFTCEFERTQIFRPQHKSTCNLPKHGASIDS